MSEQKKKTWEIIWKTWEIFWKISHVFCRNSLVSIDKRWQKRGSVWRLWKQKVQNRWWARAYTHTRRHILEEAQHHGGDQRRLFPWLATTSQEASSHARCIKWKLLPSNDMDEQGMKSRGTPRQWKEKTRVMRLDTKPKFCKLQIAFQRAHQEKSALFRWFFSLCPYILPYLYGATLQKGGANKKAPTLTRSMGAIP